MVVPSDPTSDHLTPQETTNQQVLDWGPDWADLSCPGSIVVARLVGEAERFENATVPETIEPDLVSSVGSQSLTEELEVGEEPSKPDRRR